MPYHPLKKKKKKKRMKYTLPLGKPTIKGEFGIWIKNHDSESVFGLNDSES